MVVTPSKLKGSHPKDKFVIEKQKTLLVEGLLPDCLMNRITCYFTSGTSFKASLIRDSGSS